MESQENDIEKSQSSFLKPLNDNEFSYISDLVYHYCGINLHEGKKELVRARLCRRLRELGIDSFKQYCEYLQKQSTPEEITVLIDTLSTNLTSFFRENRHFIFLQSHLPGIIKKNRENRISKLRIWSTGCSSGEEPYSIAIIVSEVLPEFPGLDAKILATDISSKVLNIAVNGLYHKDKLQEIPPNLKVKYFIHEKTFYRVSENIKKLVTFGKLNVNGPWPFKGPFDIIFCRNMMIYFDKQTQIRLVDKFYQYISPGGFLFVGHSESLIGIPHKFCYVEPTVYQKI